MASIVILVFITFIARLIYLQVFDETYKQFAERNVLQEQIVPPYRGLIYDRNENLVVGNQTLYDLMVVPSRVRNLDTSLVLETLDITRESFERRMQRAVSFSRFHPSVFMSQLDQEEAALIKESLFILRGFQVQPRYARNYEHIAGAHVFGYLSEAGREQIDSDNSYYRMGDYMGVSGMEQSFENELRGEKGLKHILVDVMNREQGSYLDGRLDEPAKPGRNLVSSLDIELQEYGERLMEGKTGSIVALDPNNGDVLALVSSPTFDPSEFVGRQRSTNFTRLLADTTDPLFNRAIAARYPPGSVMKPLYSVLGLEEDVMPAHENYYCQGAYTIRGLRIGCRDHYNPVNLHRSIQHSCNAYYCVLFRRIIDSDQYSSAAEGFTQWRSYLDSFNLIEPSGINLPNEHGGIIPDRSYFDFLYGQGRWGSTTILSLAIGQAEISVTPLQLAVKTSAIVNQGHFFKPRLVREVRGEDTSYTIEPERNDTGLDSSSFEGILPAMQDVIDNGTAWRARIPDIEWGGKTGTSQNPHGENHSMFIGVAPIDDPEIVIATVVENAGYGGAWAAPITSLMVEKFINKEISRHHTERRILDQNFIIPDEEDIANE